MSIKRCLKLILICIVYYLFVKYLVIQYFTFILSFLIVLGLSSFLKNTCYRKEIGFLILLFSYLFIIGILGLLIYYSVSYMPHLISYASDLYNQVSLVLGDIVNELQPYHLGQILVYSKSILDYLFHFFVDTGLQLISFIPLFLKSIIFFMFSSFLFWIGFDDFKDYLYKYNHSFSYFITIKNNILSTIRSYFFTQIQLMIIVFMILLFGFIVLRFSYPLLLAFLSAFLDSLPFIGVGIVLIPMIIYRIILKDYFKAFYLLLLYLLVLVLRTFLEPKLMNNQLHIPSIILFLSMIIHLEIFGVIGILISPITLTFIQCYLDNQLKIK